MHRPSLTAPSVRRISSRQAYVIAAATYLGAFGAAVFMAVMHLIRGRPSVPSDDWAVVINQAFRQLGVAVLIAVCAYLVVHHLQVTPGYFAPHDSAGTRWWQRWRRELTIGSFVILAGGLSFALMDVAALVAGTPSPEYPQQDGPGWSAANIADVLSSLTAGVVEEPLFCLIIPLCLIAAGRSILCAAIVSTTLRVAFHIYYGWTSPLLAIWAFVAVIVVLRTGAIVGTVIVHSLYDTVGSLVHMFPTQLAGVAPFVFGGIIVALVFSTVWTLTRTFDDLHTEGTPWRESLKMGRQEWVNVWLSPARQFPQQ